MRPRYEDAFAWGAIEAELQKLIPKSQKIIHERIVLRGDKPRDIVGDLVANVCLRDIELGGEHVYRGVLGMTGQAKKMIFERVVAEQLANGWITSDEAKIARENLVLAIQEVG